MGRGKLSKAEVSLLKFKTMTTVFFIFLGILFLGVLLGDSYNDTTSAVGILMAVVGLIICIVMFFLIVRTSEPSKPKSSDKSQTTAQVTSDSSKTETKIVEVPFGHPTYFIVTKSDSTGVWVGQNIFFPGIDANKGDTLLIK